MYAAHVHFIYIADMYVVLRDGERRGRPFQLANLISEGPQRKDIGPDWLGLAGEPGAHIRTGR